MKPRKYSVHEAQRLKDQGFTNKQVAEQIGCSIEWCQKYLINTIKPERYFKDRIAIYDLSTTEGIDAALKHIKTTLYPDKLLEILEDYLWNKKLRESYKYLITILFMKSRNMRNVKKCKNT